MAEKKCRYCSMMIPGDAKICPHCRKSQSAGTTRNIIGLLVLIFILYTCSQIPSFDSYRQKAQAAKSSVAPVQETTTPDHSKEKSTRALAGAMTLKSSMRNPESFKLAAVIATDSGAVCYKYRSQNGFGGMNVALAVLSKNDEIKTSEMEGFDKKWKRECVGKTGEDVVDYVEMLLK